MTGRTSKNKNRIDVATKCGLGTKADGNLSSGMADRGWMDIRDRSKVFIVC